VKVIGESRSQFCPDSGKAQVRVEQQGTPSRL